MLSIDFGVFWEECFAETEWDCNANPSKAVYQVDFDFEIISNYWSSSEFSPTLPLFNFHPVGSKSHNIDADKR